MLVRASAASTSSLDDDEVKRADLVLQMEDPVLAFDEASTALNVEVYCLFYLSK